MYNTIQYRMNIIYEKKHETLNWAINFNFALI